MSRKTEKGEKLEYLISKSNLALKEEFYLESIFLCHAIIEERLRSTLLKVKPDLGSRNKIPGCIKKLKVHINKKEFLFQEFISHELLDEIKQWKKFKRDELIHALEKNNEIINNNEELLLIAHTGNTLMRQLNSQIMKWKKKAKKTKII